MSNDDVLFGFRLRVFALAAEIGVRPACRAMGVHHSTYYRWKRRVDRWGLEALRVRERRRPRMPNELGPHLEQRILAFALAQPGLGPRRIAAELARERWGRAQDLGQRGLARALPPPAQHSLPPPRPRRRLRRPLRAPPARTRAGAARRGLPAGRAGRGRLLLRRPPLRDEGAVWQYTAIDVASGFAWAELHSSPRNPRQHCRSLVERVASELARAGWRLEAVITDNGSEFRSRHFDDGLKRLGVEQRRIRAGRPQTNGHVERLQQTVLEECATQLRRLACSEADCLECDLKQ